VAIDGNGKPLPVPPLLAETEAEQRRYQQAEQRRVWRLERRALRQQAEG